MNKKISEKALETKLREKVKQKGGVALKFESPGLAGVPDRIVLFEGKAIFVEMKAPGKKPSPRQVVVHTQLAKVGFDVRVVDSLESLETFLQEL